MGRQSARIYYQGLDHKEMVTWDGSKYQYHDKAYIWNGNAFELVWEKLKGIRYIRTELLCTGAQGLSSDGEHYYTVSLYNTTSQGSQYVVSKKELSTGITVFSRLLPGRIPSSDNVANHVLWINSDIFIWGIVYTSGRFDYTTYNLLYETSDNTKSIYDGYIWGVSSQYPARYLKDHTDTWMGRRGMFRHFVASDPSAVGSLYQKYQDGKVTTYNPSGNEFTFTTMPNFQDYTVLDLAGYHQLLLAETNGNKLAIFDFASMSYTSEITTGYTFNTDSVSLYSWATENKIFIIPKYPDKKLLIIDTSNGISIDDVINTDELPITNGNIILSHLCRGTSVFLGTELSENSFCYDIENEEALVYLDENNTRIGYASDVVEDLLIAANNAMSFNVYEIIGE